jgi:hypothetical protein
LRKNIFLNTDTDENKQNAPKENQLKYFPKGKSEKLACQLVWQAGFSEKN